MQRLGKALLISGLLTVSVVSKAWATPIQLGTHYYDVIVAPGITWDAARAAALSTYYLGLQGHLVTITSASEDNAVRTLIQNTPGSGEMWAGGYQTPGTLVTTANWNWVNGEGSFPGVVSASPYANWNGGEPNDYYGAGSEQYLGVNFSSGGWNDEGNLGLIYGYVIEYDPTTINDLATPEPASLVLMGTGLVGVAAVARRRRQRRAADASSAENVS